MRAKAGKGKAPRKAPRDTTKSAEASARGELTKEDAVAILGLVGLEWDRRELIAAYRAMSQQYHPGTSIIVS